MSGRHPKTVRPPLVWFGMAGRKEHDGRSITWSFYFYFLDFFFSSALHLNRWFGKAADFLMRSPIPPRTSSLSLWGSAGFAER